MLGLGSKNINNSFSNIKITGNSRSPSPIIYKNKLDLSMNNYLDKNSMIGSKDKIDYSFNSYNRKVNFNNSPLKNKNDIYNNYSPSFKKYTGKVPSDLNNSYNINKKVNFNKIGIDVINSNMVLMNFNKRNYLGSSTSKTKKLTIQGNEYKNKIIDKQSIITNNINIINLVPENKNFIMNTINEQKENLNYTIDNEKINTTLENDKIKYLNNLNTNNNNITVINNSNSSMLNESNNNCNSNISNNDNSNFNNLTENQNLYSKMMSRRKRKNNTLNKNQIVLKNNTINNENLKINLLQKMNEENAILDKCVDFLREIPNDDKIFINQLKLFEVCLDLEISFDGLVSGSKLYLTPGSKKPNSIFCLKKYFYILKDRYSLNEENFEKIYDTFNENNFDNTNANVEYEFYKFDVINKLYAKSQKLQIILFAIILITQIYVLMDAGIKSYIKKLMTSLMSPVVNIFEFFINGEISLKYSDFLIKSLKQDFGEKYAKIYRNYKLSKVAKISDVVIILNKNLELCALQIKQFSNQIFKFTQLKYLHNVLFEIMNEIDKKSVKSIANIFLNYIVYSIIENPIYNKRIIKFNKREIENNNNLEILQNSFLPSINLKYEYTLVLDLDETLVHYFYTQISEGMFFNRPYAIQFLCELSNIFEIYADEILDKLDPTGDNIQHRLYRNHTSTLGLYIIKDLSKIGRDLSKVIIVDNIPENFKLQPNNGIVIKTWNDDINDTQLKEIGKILKDIYLLKIQDVRPILKRVREEYNNTKSYENVNISNFI